MIKNNVYVYMYIIDQYIIRIYCAVSRDHQKCTLSLNINSGTIHLVSSSGTNGIVKQ